MTAKDISRLLDERHAKDIFIEQCKSGGTMNPPPGGLLQMDAWAMNKSWSNPKITAYEIKISRQDFLRDDKWQSAMALCNEFYWVAPPGIIEKEEISPDCGLIVTSLNGTNLYTKKKAAHRSIEWPIDVMRYILMWRAKFGPEDAENYWRGWIAGKEGKKSLGRYVGKRLDRVVRERICEVEGQNKQLVAEIKQLVAEIELLESVKQILAKHGLLNEQGQPYASYHIERMLEDARNIVPYGLTGKLRSIADSLDDLEKKINGQGNHDNL